MRIALICPDSLPCPPMRGGAIELLIDRSAPLIAQMNGHVTVFSIRDPALADHEQVHNVQFIRFDRQGYMQEVLRYLKDHFFDLIQVYNKHQWILSIKKASPKSLLVLSLHNQRLGTVADMEKSEQIIGAVDYIVTVSHFLARDMITRFPKSSGKIMTLYTGEDSSRYIPHFSPQGQEIAHQMKQKLGIPQDYVIVLYVGRLVEYKGCYQLIEAIKSVKEKFLKIALVIVGSNRFGTMTTTDYITKLMEKADELSNHVYFINFIPVNQIANYYTMGNIFVCPSQWEEPLARVLYEAMAAGLPIVTTNRGGNPEVIVNGKNGFVIDPYDDPLALARTIHKLVDDENLRHKFGKENRKLVSERYNFDQYALNLSTIYKKLMKKRKR